MKKSLYVFLCALMGSLLFLIVHRIIVFVYLAVAYTDFQGILSLNFLVVDYFTLILVSMAGLWYGIWVGLYWYEAVYQSENHKGFVDYLVFKFWPTPAYDLKAKIDRAAHKLEEDLWQLEDLAKKVPVIATPKRRIVKRKKIE